MQHERWVARVAIATPSFARQVVTHIAPHNIYLTSGTYIIVN
jgi:hypothetical protein